MQFVADRKGAVWEEDSWQDKILEWIYGHFLGRLFIKPFIRPAVSELGGRALDTAFSKVLIAPD